ncbi:MULTISPECIES: MFS transporter [Trueperella]|uniref:Inner membrane protein YqcE n=1 Tax=Trueperella bernardiae TaxID=59561 RepID=A0A0W1KIA7_9ACTO|nr:MULTISPECIES: MFS transporter [Trueperella]KTF03754.1 Inner membrane protein YqcE [Trueperella bernardiae]MCM3907414.1 MFS transporter [Trueperella bernardiae]MDK8601606.1 MFS transporter [Trueperella bernardiae]MDV6238686.1 MFS transporter [Trueperella bernardiae]OFS68787.1 MFS transporter [Trueperella sp. HMSC08H06]
MNKKNEVRAQDLSRGRRFFLLTLVSMGSSIIYTPAYLKNVFYDPLMEALDVTNAQLGQFLSAYAITALICYFPSGVIADKVRVRTLSWVGFMLTAALTFVYATLPSVGTLMMVFVGMGISTILIWWGIRFKLVRLISEEEEYSKNIGISYGLYGAAGLAVGLICLLFIKYIASATDSMRWMLIFLGVLIFVLGLLSFLIPKFEGEIADSSQGFNLSEVGMALKSPVVWMAAAIMFFVYFYYTGVTYTTPYLSSVMGASIGIVSLVSIVRQYGVTLLSGPAFGFLAKGAGSPTRVIGWGSVVAVIALVTIAFLPAGAAMAVVAAIIAILLGFIANGVFGIVSSALTEGKVPLTIFGTATGVLSVIGFAPDTFSSIWFGALIDNKGNDAYVEIFMILAGAAILATAFSFLLHFYVKKNEKKLEAAQLTAAAEAQGISLEEAADLVGVDEGVVADASEDLEG